MTRDDWYKRLRSQGSTPSMRMCEDGCITVCDDLVILFSRENPDLIGKIYDDGGSHCRITKAEWRCSKNGGKFVYILHENKSSGYVHSASSGGIATKESGIFSAEFAQPEDFENFPNSKCSENQEVADSKGKKTKQRKEKDELSFGGKVKKFWKKVKIIFWIIVGLIAVICALQAL